MQRGTGTRKTQDGSKARFDFDEYPQHNIWELMQNLWITPNEAWALTGKKILFIGSAQTPTRAQFEIFGINAQITNIDMCFEADKNNAHYHIKADFFEYPPMLDAFDLVWADYSLPLYALTIEEAKGFFALAALYLKPGGEFRAFPLNGGSPEHLVDVPDGYDIGDIQDASCKGVTEIAKILKRSKLEGAAARAELNPPNISWSDCQKMMGARILDSPYQEKFGCIFVEIVKAFYLANKEIKKGRPFNKKKLKFLKELTKYSSMSKTWVSDAFLLQDCVKAKRAVITAPTDAADKAKFNEIMIDYARRCGIPAVQTMR